LKDRSEEDLGMIRDEQVLLLRRLRMDGKEPAASSRDVRDE
jgi:hypothetical protein